MGLRSVVIVVTAAIVASACTGASEAEPDSTTAPDSTTTQPTTTSTTSTTLPDPVPIVPSSPTDPPEMPDPAVVAEDAFSTPPGYTETEGGDVFATDAAFAIGLWLPDGIVSGTAAKVYAGPDGIPVTVVSVIPTMGWRADPGLVPALAALDDGGFSDEVDAFVYETTTEAGLPIGLWSTGDGFFVAASPEPDAAIAFLSEMEELRVPLGVWETGACLYIEPREGLPWAPFPLDAVVPCDGNHNAEVIHAEPMGTDLVDYDDDRIAYERRYVCDEVFERAMGPQRDRIPMLITYMPDGDEWERGDRYLACVVRLELAEGVQLVTGRITERSDLAWRPILGSCFVASLAPDPVDCATPHVYQYLGEIDYAGSAWPGDPTNAFSDACARLLDDLPPGPEPIDVFGVDLHPYAFENGERRIRCMAYARSDRGPATVLGRFDDEWRVLGEGGISA